MFEVVSRPAYLFFGMNDLSPSPPRVAGTVVVRPQRRAAGATRPATVALSASTRTGGTTCTSVPQGYQVWARCFELVSELGRLLLYLELPTAIQAHFLM